MYAEENDIKVYLRESNTLSSTIYRRNGRDSFFLFFTDDALPVRPIYGALNVAAGKERLQEFALIHDSSFPSVLRSRIDGNRAQDPNGICCIIHDRRVFRKPLGYGQVVEECHRIPVFPYPYYLLLPPSW